jgi:hypothetical protein
MFEFEKVDINYLVNSSSENEFVYQIDRKSFYENVRKYAFDLNKFFQQEIVSDLNKEKFNVLLRKLKENERINIFESLIFIEADYLDMRLLTNLLDEEVKQLLKEELSRNHHIPLQRNRLLEFLGVSTKGKEK